MISWQLVRKLRAAHCAAATGDKVASVILFGIDHAERLRGESLRELVRRAELSDSMAAELYRGIRLARFVQRKS